MAERGFARRCELSVHRSTICPRKNPVSITIIRATSRATSINTAIAIRQAKRKSLASITTIRATSRVTSISMAIATRADRTSDKPFQRHRGGQIRPPRPSACPTLGDDFQTIENCISGRRPNRCSVGRNELGPRAQANLPGQHRCEFHRPRALRARGFAIGYVPKARAMSGAPRISPTIGNIA